MCDPETGEGPIGCDNSSYCTNGEVDEGLAYNMGPKAKCSGSQTTIEDNTDLLAAKNSNCDTISSIGFCCQATTAGIAYYNYCPETCETEAESC